MMEGGRFIGWCGGWDSNPRRPSPQGPKPEAGTGYAFCPLDLALVPPQFRRPDPIPARVVETS